jgi:tetratricopeptide (TPR) repeat protein
VAAAAAHPVRPPIGSPSVADGRTLTQADYLAAVVRCATANHAEAVADAVRWPAREVVPLARGFAPPERGLLVRAVLLHLEAARAVSGDAAWAQRSAAFTAVTHLVAPADRASIDVEPTRAAVLATLALLHGAMDVVGVSSLITSSLAVLPGDPELLLARGSLQETALALAPAGAASPAAVRDPEARATAERGLADYTAALAKAPGLIEARLRRGRVLARLGRFEEARADLEQVERRAPDSDLKYLAQLFLAEVYDREDRPRDAERAYENASAIAPAAQAPYIGLADLRSRHGRFAAAAAIIQTMTQRTRSAITDPWWGYDYGQFREIEPRLARLRELAAR